MGRRAICVDPQRRAGRRATVARVRRRVRAGFLAGLRASSQGAAPPAAAEVGAGASAPQPARPRLLALVEDFPDLFQKEVLERLLDPVDRAMLGRTGSGVRTAVKRSGMPRFGGSAEEPRAGIEPFCDSLSMFVWAVANGCPWQVEATSENLAAGGQLEVLKWARVHGCPLHESTYDAAAGGGHLEVLRWLREHEVPWTEWTCAMAAARGQLEVLRWVREHNCPWDSRTCAAAATNEQLEVLRWAIEHGCPGGERYAGHLAWTPNPHLVGFRGRRTAHSL